MAMQRRLAAADINLRCVLDLVSAGSPTEQLMPNGHLVHIITKELIHPISVSMPTISCTTK